MFKLILPVVLFAAVNRSFAQQPDGTPLFPAEITQLVPFGPGPLDSVAHVTAVASQPFSKAWQINTFNRPAAKAEYGMIAKINTPLKKGDVLWISFKARSLQSKRETGESFVEMRFDQLVDGKYKWPSHLERGVSIASGWAETSVPFVMLKDAQPDEVRLVFKFDTYPQQFEIGPVTFINYGPNVKLSSLPRSVVRYGGDEANAAWRKAAAERIDKYRKGNLAINVVDDKGKPLQGAQISIHQTRNAFNWGTATNSQLLLEDSKSAQQYRDTLTKYFNQVVFENEVKSKNWYKFDSAQTAKGVAWLKGRNISIRGHVMVWPSWQHAGPVIEKYKNDTAGLRRALLKFIGEQTSTMKGWFTEWDVLNEPFAHDVFLDLLGRQEMVKWFEAARANTPGVKLFLNDYTMFHGEGPNSGSEAFYQNIKFLQANHAPIDAIGEQAHIGGTPPPIEKVLERLDYFAQLNLPIQISEFDINSNDDEFKARYLGDFMTAVYSHPSTIGFVQWGFWEGSHWFPVAALWDKNWSLRTHGKVFTQLVNNTWKTNATGTADKNGSYQLRGFTGEYEVTVKKGNKVAVQKIVLTTTGKNATITLK